MTKISERIAAARQRALASADTQEESGTDDVDEAPVALDRSVDAQATEAVSTVDATAVDTVSTVDATAVDTESTVDDLSEEGDGTPEPETASEVETEQDPSTEAALVAPPARAWIRKVALIKRRRVIATLGDHVGTVDATPGVAGNGHTANGHEANGHAGNGDSAEGHPVSGPDADAHSNGSSENGRATVLAIDPDVPIADALTNGSAGGEAGSNSSNGTEAPTNGTHALTNGTEAPTNGAQALTNGTSTAPLSTVVVDLETALEAPPPAPARRPGFLRGIDLRRRATVAAPPVAGPSRSGMVALLVSVGIAVDAVAYTLGYTGHNGPVLSVFFTGLVGIYAACAWRLTAAHASRRERLTVSMLLGIGLLVSSILRSPLILDGFDELIHGATLHQLLSTHSLHVPNTVLPVSPYFPGLELLTIAVKSLTGLPVVLAQDVMLLLARILVVLCVFLVVERICGSARAGGLAVLIYAANPQFYVFDAQYAYETLALGLAVGVVYLVMDATREANRFALLERRTRRAEPAPQSTGSVVLPGYQRLFPTRMQSEPTVTAPEAPEAGTLRRVLTRRFVLDFVLALAGIAALAVTHHLTSWLTVVFLAATAVVLYRSGRTVAAGVVGGAAAVAAVLVGIWTAFVGTRLWSYLEPIFRAAITGVSNAIAHLHASRQLFHTATGSPPAPEWEIILMAASAAVTCLVILPALWSAARGRTMRVGALRWLAMAVAATYPLTYLARLATTSAEVGTRASTFIFFAVAVVVGGWLAIHAGAFARPLRRTLVIMALSACFLGSLLLGSGPDWNLVPGRYLVSADQRSVSAPSLALAQWASTHIPPDTHVAADRVNGALLADEARVEPVTAIGGLVNVGPIYFDHTVGSYDLALIRQARIRYLVVDDRMTQSLPMFGSYFEPGETNRPQRLTSEELHKFASAPGFRLVYDNGAIQVYDLSGVLGTPAPPMPAPASPDRSAPDADLMAAAAAVGLLVVVRARRRRTRRPVTEVGVVRWILGSIVVGMIAAAALVPTHVSPTVAGLCGLAVVAVVGLLATRGKHTDPLRAPPDKRWRLCYLRREGGQGQLVWTSAGLRTVAVTVVLAAAVVLATLSARIEWRAPDQVTLSPAAAGQTLASVQLATAAPGARLEVTGTQGVELSEPLRPTTATQTVLLPPVAGAISSTVRIVPAPSR